MKNILLLSAVLVSASVFGQIKAPQPSPMSTVTQKVGLVDVEVEYSRPGIKERKIFGELLPYGEIWRLGANASTKISFSEDVTLGGKEVPAGQYALFAIPSADSWEVIVHKNLNHWGTGNYDAAEDLVRIKVDTKKLMDTWETFTITFSNLTNTGAHLVMGWENTSVHIPIETKTNEMVEKQINKILVEGPSARDYAAGARHYLAKEENLDQALEWMTKACEMRSDAFWYMYNKAEIYGKLGRYDEAIDAAENANEMAKANPDVDYGYVKRSEQLIKNMRSKR